MKRRTYLKGMAMGVVTGFAGCTSTATPSGDQSTTEPYLPKPELKYASGLDEFPYPRWDDQLPEATLPAPLVDNEITTTQFEKDVFLTFFYSHCNTVCPRLISTLRNIQTRAKKDGHSDQVVFLAVTFDPKRDTRQRLRTYADQMNIDLDAGNWYFLRPKSPERAEQIVEKQFGVAFKRTTPQNMDKYIFTHLGLIVLANKHNRVERGYSTSKPAWQEIYEDFTTLRKREG